MINKSLIYGLGLLSLISSLSVGYAVVSTDSLNLRGNAYAINSDLNAEITNVEAVSNFKGLDIDFNYQLFNENLASNFTLNDMVLGEKVTITYTITSNEKDIDAYLNSNSVELFNTNSKYFDVDYAITNSNTNIKNDDNTMNVEVTIELIKTPILEENSSTEVELSLNVSPLRHNHINKKH